MTRLLSRGLDRSNGIREIYAGCIRNVRKFGLWNLESWVLESGIQLKEFEIQVLLTNTGIQYLESRIHSVESRIEDCPFPYMGRTVYIRPLLLYRLSKSGLEVSPIHMLYRYGRRQREWFLSPFDTKLTLDFSR